MVEQPVPADSTRTTVWRSGVGRRLFLAFLGIAALAALAAAAGLVATEQIGVRLEGVDERAGPTIAALEISRSADRIIAAAPALLATANREERDIVQQRLSESIARVQIGLEELRRTADGAAPQNDIEQLVTSLASKLQQLGDVADQRLSASERLNELRDSLFDVRDDTSRLLEPWLTVLAGQVAQIVAGAEGNQVTRTELDNALQLQRLIEWAQRQFSTAVDLLAEASTTQDPTFLPIAEFRMGLVLDQLRQEAESLPSPLDALVLERVDSLDLLGVGVESIGATRGRELELIREGNGLLAEAASLSVQLTTAVDVLANAAKDDIAAAIDQTILVQSWSRTALVVIAIVSLATSLIIVWRYVGRSIVRRLNSLSSQTLAVANGRLGRPVEAFGDDEIGSIGRAVELFRQNAIERSELLAERAAAATKLERVVAERTSELRQSLSMQVEQRRQLEHANAYKARFLAAASHDLRQPLHALNMYVGQLTTAGADTPFAGTISGIDAAVGSMNDLLNDLLDMSKLESGQLEPNVSVFPVMGLLERMQSAFDLETRARGLGFRVTKCSAWLRSDPVLLERILLNLVTNAVQNTERGGVVVGCRRRGGGIRIDVCDSGPGIPEDQQKRVFDEFVRIDKASAKPGSGLGLGLAIVKRLASLLGHEVQVDSTVGRGTRFSVVVPSASPAEASDQQPTSDDFDVIRDRLIVAIDDDPMALRSMRDILIDWGCRVVAVKSESEAIPLLAAMHVPPDVIICDLHLADKRSGLAAVRNIRSKYADFVPAFIISGDTSPERRREAEAMRLRLLNKPLSPMRLRTMLSACLKEGAEPSQTSKSPA